jgi:hypothetical protein
VATNSPTMIAGADEPATLSGLCQPMAKTAMVQEFGPSIQIRCRFRQGYGELAMRGENLRFDHLKGTSCHASRLWVIWVCEGGTAGEKASRSAVLARTRGSAL